MLDHRKFWDAMHGVGLEEFARIEHRLAIGMVETFGLDISALALDMTNFATYIDTTNDKAPIAARGLPAEHPMTSAEQPVASTEHPGTSTEHPGTSSEPTVEQGA